MLKKYGYLIVTGSLLLMFILLAPERKPAELAVYADTGTNLLVPQKNVVVAVVDIKKTGITDPGTFRSLLDLEEGFTSLQGVTKVDSLISASVIMTMDDDIIVSRIIPRDRNLITDEFIRELPGRIGLYPELQPYINGTMDTLLFHVYFGNSVSPGLIDGELADLQKLFGTRLPFDYTGRSPILAETEKLLTKDIAVFLPLLFILVMAVFLSLRNWKAIGLSWFLILLSGGVSYSFIRFLGMEDSPLILLIPVFGMGLLSDYLIHYFYHYFYETVGTGGPSVRKRLLFPLTLTVLSTLTGFLSLIFLNGSGHLQLGSLIASSIVLTFAGVFLWLPYLEFKKTEKTILPRFRDVQIRVFTFIQKNRKAVYIIVLILGVWGAFQLSRLRIEPYPIEQLPEKNTVKKADTLINREFFGTVPFFMEVDTGEQGGILSKETILQMDGMHRIMDEDETVGYSYSLLTVLKRMNYFFQGSEETLLTDTAFDDIYPMLIEQYLLYYSSSVDPLEYESLLDASNRYFSIKGMLYYRNVEDLNRFKETVEELQKSLPDGWSLAVYGMADELSSEQRKLSGNWIFSFFFGSLLIFLTVLLFYRNVRLALLSLIPAVFSMIFSFGIIAGASLSIDTFSIIFVAIITGLVIDYSIHTLAAIETMKEENLLEKGYGYIVNYSGIPIFLSFLTSLFSFAVLLLSSFRGARNLGVLLITSLIVSYFLSMFLLPLLALPKKNIKEVNI